MLTDADSDAASSICWLIFWDQHSHRGDETASAHSHAAASSNLDSSRGLPGACCCIVSAGPCRATLSVPGAQPVRVPGQLVCSGDEAAGALSYAVLAHRFCPAAVAGANFVALITGTPCSNTM